MTATMMARPDYSPDESGRNVVFFLLRFEGRIGRPHYRRGLLICALIFALFVYFLSMLGIRSETVVFLFPILGLSCWVFAAINVKRLHDFGWNGWWILLLIPLAVAIGLDFIAANILFVAWLAVMSFVPGRAGPNKYGPDLMGSLAEEMPPTHPAVDPTTGR